MEQRHYIILDIHDVSLLEPVIIVLGPVALLVEDIDLFVPEELLRQCPVELGILQISV